MPLQRFKTELDKWRTKIREGWEAGLANSGLSLLGKKLPPVTVSEPMVKRFFENAENHLIEMTALLEQINSGSNPKADLRKLDRVLSRAQEDLADDGKEIYKSFPADKRRTEFDDFCKSAARFFKNVQLKFQSLSDKLSREEVNEVLNLNKEKLLQRSYKTQLKGSLGSISRDLTKDKVDYNKFTAPKKNPPR